MTTDDPWLIHVTNADIRAARHAWDAARDRGDDPARVAELLASYWRLVSTQAQQIADEFRADGRLR